MGTRAVFWDRDNTLTRDPGYISDPAQVELLPGAAEALKRLADAGYENILATNQSGIARGLFDEATLRRIHDRLQTLLAAGGAALDAIYYCPYLDGEEAKVASYRRDSDLRKPKPGMLVKASLERGIDLVASWSIGDSLRDAQAGRAAGCRTILIDAEAAGHGKKRKSADVDFIVGSLKEAVDVVLKHTRQARGGAEAGRDGESTAVLQEILDFLRMVDRRERAEDFSLGKMMGALVQILALAGLIWAVFSIIRNEPASVQSVKLLVTLVLQTMALTCFTLSSRK